jgi:hypothetical protein
LREALGMSRFQIRETAMDRRLRNPCRLMHSFDSTVSKRTRLGCGPHAAAHLIEERREKLKLL